MRIAASSDLSPNINTSAYSLAHPKYELVTTNKALLLFSLTISVTILLAPIYAAPSAFAQSPEVSAEWALFNQILLIGIAVGLVVFGIMFYAIIRYREKTQRAGAV